MWLRVVQFFPDGRRYRTRFSLNSVVKFMEMGVISCKFVDRKSICCIPSHLRSYSSGWTPRRAPHRRPNICCTLFLTARVSSLLALTCVSSCQMKLIQGLSVVILWACMHVCGPTGPFFKVNLSVE